MRVVKSMSVSFVMVFLFFAAAFGESDTAAVQKSTVKSTETVNSAETVKSTATVSQKIVKKQKNKAKPKKAAAGKKAATEKAATEKAAATAAWGDAPDFTAKTPEGAAFTLSSLKGKVILLNFWATWCPHCRYEVPDLIQLKSDHQKDGLEIVGVSVDDGNVAGVKAFVQDKGINYPVVMFDKGVEAQYRDITGVPTTFVIDKNGNQVDKYVGAVQKDVIESQIKKLLK